MTGKFSKSSGTNPEADLIYSLSIGEINLANWSAADD
jgi:hypothetical protein